MEIAEDIINIDPGAKRVHYQKGTILQHKGRERAKTYFVEKGLLRSYIIDSKGREHIFMFAPEEWIVADVESLEFHQPTKLFIDCIENSDILEFDKDKLMDVEVSRAVMKSNMKLVYRRMGILQRRVIMQMSAPAIDRYTYFLETYPGLLGRVPQHMIASYLGITPQALSTIRKEMSRNP